MTTVAATYDPGPKPVGTRLLVACGLSLALHVLLLLAVPVNPTGGIPNVSSMIYARLAPAADETSTETAALPPEQPQPTPVEQEVVRPASEDPLAAPEPKKDEAQPESKPAPPPSSPQSGVELPFIRDPTYYTAKELDAWPKPLTEPRLHYPEAAVAARLDGRVRVLLLIDEFGVVNEASVVEAQPPGYFEEAARSVFLALRFSPGTKQGRAVKSRVVMHAEYVYADNERSVR